MTLEEFRETAMMTSSIGMVINDLAMMGTPGWVYADKLYIERLADGEPLLVIGNCQWTGELRDLEARLYQFGLDEGILEVSDGSGKA